RTTVWAVRPTATSHGAGRGSVRSAAVPLEHPPPASAAAPRTPGVRRLPGRARPAARVGPAVAELSRRTGLRSRRRIRAPDLLAELAGGKRVALVSATNGKTTTCHLLAAAVGTAGPVATNALGANMGPGLVAALADGREAPTAILEVDERWVPKVLADLHRP